MDNEACRYFAVPKTPLMIRLLERPRQSILHGNAALNPWNHTRVTNAISAAPSDDGLAIERL
ncbi:MAG: hypothetical protein CL912_08025 [Deltaproteobacteria bacterium]|nr:hypothetical protein [Deltaproteobacteria bacterium]